VSFMRKVILTVAGNRAMTKFVSRYGMRLGAGRFVAGEEWEQAAAKVRALNEAGMIATMDYLGESVTDKSAAEAARDTYLDLLGNIASARVEANVSLKLTQMGLDISPAFCLENVRAIAGRAKDLGSFVRVDMEDAARTEATIGLFRDLRTDFPNVGLVIQSYLYRSEKDIRDLADLTPNLRICKGAYLEKPDVAFPRKADVDENFKKLVTVNLKLGSKTCLATHDERIIDWACRLIREQNIPKDAYEFQMLYGIRPALQRRLAGEGHTVRVYVPFGKQWYAYYTRRLAERPANLAFILGNLFRS
jgi:proline dehydrogenase